MLGRHAHLLRPGAHIALHNGACLTGGEARGDRGVDGIDAGEHVSAVRAAQPLQGDVGEDREQPVRADVLQAAPARGPQPALARQPGGPRLPERLTGTRGVGAERQAAAHRPQPPKPALVLGRLPDQVADAVARRVVVARGQAHEFADAVDDGLCVLLRRVAGAVQLAPPLARVDADLEVELTVLTAALQPRAGVAELPARHRILAAAPPAN